MKILEETKINQRKLKKIMCLKNLQIIKIIISKKANLTISTSANHYTIPKVTMDLVL